MEFIADLHVHSHFSRATSRQLDLEHLWIWAQRKGISVVGTGDFTHPGWLAEIKERLVPDGAGLYALRRSLERELEPQVPPSCRGEVRFMLTTEISNIYKHDGRTRKVHNLINMPDLEAAETFGQALGRIGNIRSDGRPILGLDSRDLLEIALDTTDQAVFIPAHIWTPWFSCLGSKSGFDSIEQCYRDLCGHIYAVETGLSSDPPMNWRLSSLDGYCLVSSSDAHSPARLGRQATLFSCDRSYPAMFAALRDPAAGGFGGTLEFFPELGKYHFDGHRKCGVRLSPAQTHALDGVCPGCHKPVTLGVSYRVDELADRPVGAHPPGVPPFESLVALGEVLSEVLGVGPGSKAVARASASLLEELGPELTVLREVPTDELRRVGGGALAEAVRRMRAGEVELDGGYDGEYGRVTLMDEQERLALAGQTSLFGSAPRANKKRRGGARAIAGSDENSKIGARSAETAPPRRVPKSPVEAAPGQTLNLFTEASSDPLEGLSQAQREAAAHEGSAVVIVAGPGTGKTRTLTRRIAHRVSCGTDPASVLAVTFTNKAATEMRQRLAELLGGGPGGQVRVSTFHALALAMVNEFRRGHGLAPAGVVGEQRRPELLAELCDGAGDRELVQAARELSEVGHAGGETELSRRYRALLDQRSLVDLDHLVPAAVDLLRGEQETLERWRRRCRVVCVDEYQDVNRSQYDLVRLLCPGQGADLCVIGDPDQAIYSFRGADPRYFLRFCQDYPDAHEVMLQRSYRTGGRLLAAAHQLICHNKDRANSETWSDLPGAVRVISCETLTPAAEAEFVVHSVERLLGGITFFSVDSGRTAGVGAMEPEETELSFGDVAVLFRQRSQAEHLVEAFERSLIPYTCSVQRTGAEILEPVLGLLGGVIRQEAHGKETAGHEADPAPAPDPELVAMVQDMPPASALELLVSRLCAEEDQAAALRLVHIISAVRHGQPGRLQQWAPTMVALAATLDESDVLDERAEAVSLLTLHASKGLEFPVVFIVGCEEGLLPNLAGDREVMDQRVEEERRLMFVGMTRSRRQLILVRARRRAARGEGGDRKPSRFISEISDDLLHHTTPEPLPRGRKKRQLPLF